MNVLSSHPITHDDLVLCGMGREELTCLKLDKLKSISLQLGIGGVTGRKKADYADKLLALIQNCICCQ